MIQLPSTQDIYLAPAAKDIHRSLKLNLADIYPQPKRLLRRISVGGRFNLVCINENGPELFIATRTGVYYGNKKTLKGKADWIQVGYGLPHCKVYGLHYHSEAKVLTVGMFGRGVWRYRF